MATVLVGMKLQRSLTSLSHVPLHPSLFYDFSIICIIPTSIFRSNNFRLQPKFLCGCLFYKIKNNLIHLLTQQIFECLQGAKYHSTYWDSIDTYIYQYCPVCVCVCVF